MENVLCYHNGAQCQIVHRNFHRDSTGVEREKSHRNHLRHRNLMCLYGYSSWHMRELLHVYEHVPNGTVACHFHGDLAKAGFLPWPAYPNENCHRDCK